MVWWLVMDIRLSEASTEVGGCRRSLTCEKIVWSPISLFLQGMFFRKWNCLWRQQTKAAVLSPRLILSGLYELIYDYEDQYSAA